MNETRKRGRKGVLSVAIDPLLIEGGRRITHMADAIVEQFGGTYTKKQVVNNIRSRMLVLTQKGYTIEKAEGRLVRLVPPVVTETPASTVTA